jgi:hypothetical protein
MVVDVLLGGRLFPEQTIRPTAKIKGMRNLVAAALCLLAMPAAAANLQGQWSLERPNAPGMGTILIDAERRAVWNTRDDKGRTTALIGYVANSSDSDVVIPFTDRSDVYRFHCTVQSEDLLECYIHYLTPSIGRPGIIMKRVGPGPQRITLP